MSVKTTLVSVYKRYCVAWRKIHEEGCSCRQTDVHFESADLHCKPVSYIQQSSHEKDYLQGRLFLPENSDRHTRRKQATIRVLVST